MLPKNFPVVGEAYEDHDYNKYRHRFEELAAKESKEFAVKDLVASSSGPECYGPDGFLWNQIVESFQRMVSGEVVFDYNVAYCLARVMLKVNLNLYDESLLSNIVLMCLPCFQSHELAQIQTFIPGKVMEGSIGKLLYLQDLLEKCQYQNFFSVVRSSDDQLMGSIMDNKNLLHRLRRRMASFITLSFKSMTLIDLRTILAIPESVKFTDDPISGLAKEYLWKLSNVDGKEVITMPEEHPTIAVVNTKGVLSKQEKLQVNTFDKSTLSQVLAALEV